MDTTDRVQTVLEPARHIPVRDEVDVLVAGGGLGGVSAAVAAARAGARTLLVERNGFPGGVATAGMCCSVFNCYYTPSHELIVKGNALEFVDELAKAEGPGSRWHDHKGHIIYDIERGKLALIELLERAGVHYLFDTMVANAVMEGDTIRGVVVESKSGREAVRAKAVVDATGDADVAHMAGAPLRKMDNETRPGKHSYVFRVGNVDVDRFIEYLAEHPDQYPPYMDVDWAFDEAYKQYKETGTFLFPHGGGIQMDLIQKAIANGDYVTNLGTQDNLAAFQMHAIRDLGVVHMVTGFFSFDGLDIARITEAMTEGKRMAFMATEMFRKYMPGFERACVIGTADDLGVRISRWIEGEFDFTKEMRDQPSHFEDAIGRGVVQHNYVKNPAQGAWGVQSFRDATFDIPYRCLVPRRVEGLLMGAGRSVSASNPSLLRVMAHTMVVGQGAGAAAALAAADECPPRHVDICRLQKELMHQGVVLK